MKGYIMSEENKKIKIVDGDGSTLDISPVYNHIKDVISKKKNTKKRNKSSLRVAASGCVIRKLRIMGIAEA